MDWTSAVFLKGLSLRFQVYASQHPDFHELLRAEQVLGFLLFYAVVWSSYVILVSASA